MKVSKEQRTQLTRFCWRTIDSIQVRPGTTLATSFNVDKTLALYDFWDIEFKSRAYFYRQVTINQHIFEIIAFLYFIQFHFQIRNMVATMISAGNGYISIRDVYEMLTIPSKHSWPSPIKPVSASALYLTNVEYPPGSIPDNESDNVTDSNRSSNLEIDDDDEQLVNVR